MQNEFSFYKVLSSEEVKNFESSVLEVRYKHGETICKQGTMASHVMLVKEGRAKLVQESRIRNLILKIVQNGDFLQLPSLFEENTFKYSVVAIENTVIWLIDKKFIAELIKSNSNFAVEIIKTINRDKLEIIDRFTCLTQKQAHGRIADAIIYLSSQIYKKDQFEMTLSRRDIAEFTGMSTETVVRILKEFKSDGILKMSGKKVDINSPSLLHKLSEVG